jgi:Glycosyl hydrolase family 26
MVAFAFVLVTASIIVVQLLATPSQAYPASLVPSQGAYLGSRVQPRGNESERQALERVEAQIGRHFDIFHTYTDWNMAIPTSTARWAAQSGRIPMINWRAQRTNGSIVSWSSIASGQEDGWIGERADAFRNFGFPVYLVFHHEPENDQSAFGSPADFAAAFRHVVDIFRSHGVTNVAFVFNLLAFSFAPGTGYDADAFYPGDPYVDIIGADGYNWAPGRPGSAWTSFGQIFQNAYDFAVAHGKPLMAAEYGVQEDPNDPNRKAQWFQDALATIKGWPLFKGLVYFDSNRDQPWVTDSSAISMAGYAAMAADPYLNGHGAVPSPTPPPPVSGPLLTNQLNAGPQGASIQTGGGAGRSDPFDTVSATNGSTLTYDRHHAFGRYAAKHVLRPGSDSYYGWSGTRTLWFGRIYVRLKTLPSQNLRLVRADMDGDLRCSIDVMPSGALQFNDQNNAPVVSTSIPVNTRRWVRIEWRVNHETGSVTIKLFDRPNSTRPTQVVSANPGPAIGFSADGFQFGRSGNQPFGLAFWTDNPALSSTRYLGPVSR